MMIEINDITRSQIVDVAIYLHMENTPITDMLKIIIDDAHNVILNDVV